MWKLVGVIGLIVMCAGIDLLWQSRREARFWSTTFVRIFRALLAHQRPQTVSVADSRGRHAVRVSLALVLGPILLALGATLMVLYPNL